MQRNKYLHILKLKTENSKLKTTTKNPKLFFASHSEEA